MPTSREADYAVGTQGAAWKKDVWPTVSGLPRRVTPRHCAPPSVPRWRIRTSRAIGRAIAARPAEVTSCSWSASTAPATSGRLPASSKRICAWTITSLSTTSVQLATHPRRGSCATSWTRRSTPSGPWSRRSRYAAMRPSGSRLSAGSQASTSRARNIDGHTTGRSGAGIGSGRAQTKRLRSRRNVHPAPGDRNRRGRHVLRTDLQRVYLVTFVRSGLDLARPARADLGAVAHARAAGPRAKHSSPHTRTSSPTGGPTRWTLQGGG